MKHILGGALASLFLVACEAPVYQIAEQRIINGKEATSEEFRAVVALVQGPFNAAGDRFFSFCTGTLIDPEWVLTAAHCVEGTKPEDMHVLFGTSDNINEDDADQIEKVVDTDQIFVNPRFNVNNLGGGNDIALIHLTEPFPSPEEDPEVGVTPIPFNIDPLNNRVGDPFIAVGFGTTDPGDAPPNSATGGGLKRFVELTLNDINAQLTFYGEGTSANVCFGDSGGPDLMDFDGELRVIGVHSFVQFPSCGGTSASQRTDVQVDNFLDPIIQSPILPEPPHFIADGVCEAIGGYADPDCFCQRDDFCDRRCPSLVGAADADCSVNAEEGGCSTTPATQSSTPISLVLLSFFSMFTLALRRRN